MHIKITLNVLTDICIIIPGIILLYFILIIANTSPNVNAYMPCKMFPCAIPNNAADIIIANT